MERIPLDHKNYEKIKLVVSDLHLGSGMFLESGERNVLENFVFDREFSEFLENLSFLNEDPDFPVELILNGDILDFLSVNYKETYFNFISETVSLTKLKMIIEGHPVFFDALRKFISKKNKSITYVVGNHDADFFFKRTQEYFKLTVGGKEFAEKINFIDDDPVYRISGGIEIHHGNQFEKIHSFNFSDPFINKKKQYLDLPWGSLFIMNVVNRFKKEREHLDQIYPHSIFMLYLLFTDTFFALRFMLYTVKYFITTRLIQLRVKWKLSLLDITRVIKEEVVPLYDGEKIGRALLRSNKDLFAVIMGHTHRPKEVRYPSGQVYINTGTWMKTVNLDLAAFGRSVRQPFCIIAYPRTKKEEKPLVLLLEWKGTTGPYRYFIS